MPKVWRAPQRQWVEAWPGVEVSEFHRHGVSGGGAAIFRLRAGARIPHHDHVSGKHTYVVEGTLEFGEIRVHAGDGLWTEPGDAHEVVAVTDAQFIGVAPPKRPV